MNLILLGPQGSGKGTQAEILVEKFDLNYFEAGKILRSIPEIHDILNRGELVPDEYMARLAEEFISTHPEGDLLFDGYPRTIAEYEDLKILLTKSGKQLDLVINIEITEKETMKRLLARNREDDKPETIQKRLAIYRDQTHPVFEKAIEEGRGVEVNGMQSIEAIAAEIEKVINEKINP